MGVGNCRRVISLRALLRCQPAEVGEIEIAQPLAVVEQPIVVEVRQQIAVVQSGCSLQRLRRSAQPLKVGKVKPIVCGGVPLDGIALAQQPGLTRCRGRQRALELVEVPAQIDPGGSFPFIRPEDVRQAFALYWAAALQQQVGQ